MSIYINFWLYVLATFRPTLKQLFEGTKNYNIRKSTVTHAHMQ
jgi:hypothetical protein